MSPIITRVPVSGRGKEREEGEPERWQEKDSPSNLLVLKTEM